MAHSPTSPSPSPPPPHHHRAAAAAAFNALRLIRRLNQNPFPEITFSSTPFLSFLSTTTTTKPLTKPQLKTLILFHCANGKFSNLIQTVVASPSVLLTACQNLASLPSQPGQLGPDSVAAGGIDLIELCNDEFEMGFSCFGVSGSKGGILVLSDFRLKIVIEAVRMVLEAVYDAGFVTFAYGGVGFGNVRFDEGNVERLCGLIEERIDDRYLDEILVITSGSKVLTMDLKNWVVRYLEELDLKVDKLKTVIHSAVWEKIDFLGMELQAVPPSVLRPPMSEKAKWARKKYLRQKEVKALELINARETNRKKLGMKIFSHVFKKLRKSNDGFKHEYQIEDEVKEMFSTWAKEVMKEYLESLEERREFHRQLTSGDFLFLKRIRDQLLVELVNAYDEFQEQVDKYLNPVKAQRALEDEKWRQEEEEEREYSYRTVEDLTKLCIRVAAPIEFVRKVVRLVGFTNKLGRPRPLKKHDATKLETIRHFTKDLKVLDSNGDEEIYFPTEWEVSGTGDGGFADPKPVDGALTLALIRLAYDDPSLRCIAHFCEMQDTVLYRVRLLQKE
ncbi:Nuclear intron maturase 3, mitochondrial-like protein [Drosera capensis]